MIEFKNYVEQKDLVEAMAWYEQGVVEKEHIPKIQSAFEVLKSISDETKDKLVEFYRSVKMMESSEFIRKLKSVQNKHAELKLELTRGLVNELKFNEIKIVTSIPRIEDYMKELIKISRKEDEEPDAKRIIAKGLGR